MISYHTSTQAEVAIRAKTALKNLDQYDKAIVTEIQPASAFWLATGAHQQYFEKRETTPKLQ